MSDLSASTFPNPNELGNNPLPGGSGAPAVTSGAGNNPLPGGSGAPAVTSGAGNNPLPSEASVLAATSGAGNNPPPGEASVLAATSGAGNNPPPGGSGAPAVTSGAGNNPLPSEASVLAATSGAGNNPLPSEAGASAVTSGEGVNPKSGVISDATQPTPTAPALSLQAADIYQQQTLVLSQVNFSIQPGEFVYLIGKTGAGKSSLLKTLYGDLPLQVGTGQVGGLSLAGLKSAELPALRRKLGIVFQDFQLLYDRTVSENLLFVLRATGWKDPAKMKQRSAEVLKLVGLTTKDFKMPHELSGGEQQRVVVARALLNDPTLILADEPTGNLDPETSLEIMALLTQVAQEQGAAVLMATHDYLIIDRFPARLLRCEAGQVTDLGAILF